MGMKQYIIDKGIRDKKYKHFLYKVKKSDSHGNDNMVCVYLLKTLSTKPILIGSYHYKNGSGYDSMSYVCDILNSIYGYKLTKNQLRLENKSITIFEI